MGQRKATIDFSYFGKNDCRTNRSPRKKNQPVTKIVIHNGDNAKANQGNWKCRISASHYTIDRDGKIYQHVGEERIAWHVKRNNTNSIGIELQILPAWKSKKSLGSCNGIDKKMAKKMGMSQEALVRKLCAPTLEQYRAIKALIADIKSRHPISKNGVVGHCELVRRGGHGDPRAFDWKQIWLSNIQKMNFVKTNNTACSWYHLY
jgi:N-acetylmuramoyl-L-alanine amidase